MDKKIKNSVIVIFSLLIALSFSMAIVSFNNPKTSLAEETPTPIFKLLDGAGVSTDNNYYGIRWQTSINSAYVNSLGEYSSIEMGTLVIPASKVTNENDFVFGSDKIAYDSSKYDYYYNGTLVKVLTMEDSYIATALQNGYFGGAIAVKIGNDEVDENKFDNIINTNLYAKSYIKVVRNNSDVEYFYSTADSIRSIYGVALAEYLYTPSNRDTMSSMYLGSNTITIESNALTVGKAKNQFVSFTNTIPSDCTFYVDAKQINPVYKNNGVFVDFDNLSKGIHYVSAKNGNNTYSVKVSVVDEIIIKTAAELKQALNLSITNATATSFDEIKTLGITYKLANNIDASSITFDGIDIDVNEIDSNIICGFTGIFDGQGYTISNLKVGKGGLFGIVNGGTIKNVAFKNLECLDNCALGCFISSDSKLENVFISLKTKVLDIEYKYFGNTVVTDFLVDWIDGVSTLNLFTVCEDATVTNLVIDGKVSVGFNNMTNFFNYDLISSWKQADIDSIIASDYFILENDYIVWSNYGDFITWKNSLLTASSSLSTEYSNWLNRSSENAGKSIDQYIVYKAWANSNNCYDMDNSRVINYKDYEMYLEYNNYVASNTGTFDIVTYIGWVNSTEYKQNPSTYTYNDYANRSPEGFELFNGGSFTITTFNYRGTNYRLNNGATLSDIQRALPYITFSISSVGKITANMTNVSTSILSSKNKTELSNILAGFSVYKLSDSVVKIDGTANVGGVNVDICFYLGRNGSNNKIYSTYNTVISVNSKTTTISLVAKFN